MVYMNSANGSEIRLKIEHLVPERIKNYNIIEHFFLNDKLHLNETNNTGAFINWLILI